MPDWDLTAQGFRIFPSHFFTQTAEEPKIFIFTLRSKNIEQGTRKEEGEKHLDSGTFE